MTFPFLTVAIMVGFVIEKLGTARRAYTVDDDVERVILKASDPKIAVSADVVTLVWLQFVISGSVTKLVAALPVTKPIFPPTIVAELASKIIV